MGRPSRLEQDPGLTERFCKALEEGAPFDWVCEAEQVEPSMGRRWERMGADGTEPYASFRHAVMRAKAKGKLARLGDALAGDAPRQSNGPGKSAQWYLERTDRNFQPRINVKVEEEMGLMLRVLERVADTETYERFLAEVANLDDEGLPLILSDDEPAAQTEH